MKENNKLVVFYNAEKDAFIASRELAVERGDLSQGPRPTEEIDFDFEGK